MPLPPRQGLAINHHGAKRFRQNPKIKPQGPGTHVLDVELALPPIAQAIAAGHLPESGDALGHLETLEMPALGDL
jgi:hypothetical protein